MKQKIESLEKRAKNLEESINGLDELLVKKFKEFEDGVEKAMKAHQASMGQMFNELCACLGIVIQKNSHGLTYKIPIDDPAQNGALPVMHRKIKSLTGPGLVTPDGRPIITPN